MKAGMEDSFRGLRSGGELVGGRAVSTVTLCDKLGGVEREE